MPDGDHRRFWSTLHANGWCAWVAECEDGLFVAGIYGPGRKSAPVYRSSFDSAASAALHLLHIWTDHLCNDQCTPWTETE